MNSAMSIDNGVTVPDAPPAAQRLLGPRAVLFLVGLCEASDGFRTLSAIAGDASHHGHGLAGILNTAQIVSHPFLAMAALIFALIGGVRDAIIALAAILVMNWLSEIRPVVLHGLELDDPIGGILSVSQMIAMPLMAACAIALAKRGERLGLATTLVALPTLFAWASAVLFAIAVSIHGF